MPTSEKIAFVILILVLGINLNSLQAQKSLSFNDCLALAKTNNISLQQAQNAIDNAMLDEKLAEQSRYPSLSGNSGLNMNIGRTIDPTTNEFNNETFISNTYSVSSGMLLFGGGRIKNNLKQARITAAAANSDRMQSENDIALQLAALYLNAIFAEENRKLSETQVVQSNNQLDLINKLIGAGVRPRNEALDIEAQIASNEQNLILAENARETAMLQIKQLLRISLSEDVTIQAPNEIEVTTDPDIITFEELYQTAINNQPSVKSAKLREESSILGIDIAKSALYPSLSIGGGLSTNYSNRGIKIVGEEERIINQTIILNDVATTIGFEQTLPLIENSSWFNQVGENLSFGLGLNLAVPIYNNGTGRIGVERAKLAQENAKLFTDQVEQQIQVAVMQALADSRSSKRALQAFEKTEKSRLAAYENGKKLYEAGGINSYELTTLQSQYELAAINTIREKYNYIFSTKIVEFYLGKEINL